MLLTDLELAARLGSSYFTGLPSATQKRRLRKMAADAGITPVVRGKKDWVFREEDISRLAQAWDSISPKEADHHIGMSGAASKASKSLRAREYLIPIKPAPQR